MKLGAHIYLWTERWSDAETGLFDRARGLGLDLIELSVGLDVKFSSVQTRRAALEFHRGIINQAAELGAVAYAGALYGRPGKVLRRRPPAEEFPRTAEGLHTLAAYAQSAGVKLVIEPMSRFRSHVINTPAQALRMLELADQPNLHLLLDTYHLVTEVRDYAAAIKSVGDRLWGLHACENDRGVPGGGLLPWPEIFAALKTTKAEYVGFEGYNTGIGDFGWRRGMFQNVCPDGDAFVREAVAFTRRQL